MFEGTPRNLLHTIAGTHVQFVISCAILQLCPFVCATRLQGHFKHFRPLPHFRHPSYLVTTSRAPASGAADLNPRDGPMPSPESEQCPGQSTLMFSGLWRAHWYQLQNCDFIAVGQNVRSVGRIGAMTPVPIVIVDRALQIGAILFLSCILRAALWMARHSPSISRCLGPSLSPNLS